MSVGTTTETDRPRDNSQVITPDALQAELARGSGLAIDRIKELDSNRQDLSQKSPEDIAVLLYKSLNRGLLNSNDAKLFLSTVRQLLEEDPAKLVDVNEAFKRVPGSRGRGIFQYTAETDQFDGDHQKLEESFKPILGALVALRETKELLNPLLPADRQLDPRDPRVDLTTDLAIKAFQAANGLTVDGVVGPETNAALRSADRKSFSLQTEVTTGDQASNSGSTVRSGEEPVTQGQTRTQTQATTSASDGAATVDDAGAYLISKDFYDKALAGYQKSGSKSFRNLFFKESRELDRRVDALEKSLATPEVQERLRTDSEFRNAVAQEMSTLQKQMNEFREHKNKTIDNVTSNIANVCMLVGGIGSKIPVIGPVIGVASGVGMLAVKQIVKRVGEGEDYSTGEKWKDLGTGVAQTALSFALPGVGSWALGGIKTAGAWLIGTTAGKIALGGAAASIGAFFLGRSQGGTDTAKKPAEQEAAQDRAVSTTEQS